MDHSNMQNSYIEKILSIWINPRDAISFFIKNKTRFTHLKILFTVSFACLLQFIAFLLIIKVFPFSSKRMTPWFLMQGFFWHSVLFFGGTALLANFTSLVLFYIIRFLGGVGDLLQTKTAVYLSSLCIIPIGLLVLLLQWSLHTAITTEKQGLEGTIFLGCIVFLLQFVVQGFLIHGMCTLCRMLSETHKISIGRAAAATSAGIIGFLLCATLIIYFVILGFSSGVKG